MFDRICRVKRYRFAAHREPLNVRFAPKASELQRRREMSLRANFGSRFPSEYGVVPLPDGSNMLSFSAVAVSIFCRDFLPDKARQWPSGNVRSRQKSLRGNGASRRGPIWPDV